MATNPYLVLPDQLVLDMQTSTMHAQLAALRETVGNDRMTHIITTWDYVWRRDRAGEWSREDRWPYTPGVYRHFRNNKLYLLLGISRDRTHKGFGPMVEYMALYYSEDGQNLHRRTYDNFFQQVNGEFEDMLRFTLVPRKEWVAELTDPAFYNLVQAYLGVHGVAPVPHHKD